MEQVSFIQMKMNIIHVLKYRNPDKIKIEKGVSYRENIVTR